MRKLTLPITGKQKDVVNPIASTRDDESKMQRDAKRLVRERNDYEKKHTFKKEFNILHGYTLKLVK